MFGQIIHAVFLRKPDASVVSKIKEVSDMFFNLDLLKTPSTGKSDDLADSFMGNEDSTDKIKEMWAFNLPCVLLVNAPASVYWQQRIKSIYKEIYTDLQLCVKRSLAASIIEIAKLHLDQDLMLDVV